MRVFTIATFSYGFYEWRCVYDGDHHLTKQYMKDDVVGKASENCAMKKYSC